MKTIKRPYLILSIIIALIFIFPFLYIIRYTQYSTDDFCRLNSLSLIEYFEVLKLWYLEHNGRFINAIIASIPIKSLFIYRLLLGISFILFGIALYIFFKRLCELFKLPVTGNEILFISVLWFVVIIGFLPSLFEFFYWYAAVTVYLLGFIVFLFFLTSILKLYMQHQVRNIWMILLIIIIVGSNELLFGIINFLLGFLLLFDLFKSKRINYQLLLFNMVSWASSLFMVLSPGMSSRRVQFHYGGNLYGSFKVAIIYGAKYSFLFFTEVSYVLFSLLVFIIIYKSIKLNITIKPLQPVYLGIISYISIISLYFISFYATGLLSNDGRIGNLIRLIMSVFFLLNTINMAIYLRQKKPIPWLESKYIPVLLTSFLLFFLFFTNANYIDLRKDFADKSFKRMEIELQNRITVFKNTDLEELSLKKIDGTRILKSGDKLMHMEWVNSCYRDYINKKYDIHVREITLIE